MFLFGAFLRIIFKNSIEKMVSHLFSQDLSTKMNLT